jgi:hypothetical protein
LFLFTDRSVNKGQFRPVGDQNCSPKKMKPRLSILLLAVISICAACEKQHDHSPPKEEDSEALDLPTRSDDELAEDLRKLKFVLSDTKDVSETHFVGSQSELDRVLGDLRGVLQTDQHAVTWVPELSTNDKELEGVIQIRAQPEHLKNLMELIHQFEQEVQRRKASDGEQDGSGNGG